MAGSKEEAELAKVAAAQAKVAIAAANTAAAQAKASAAASAAMAKQAADAERLAQLQEAGARKAEAAAERSAAMQTAAAQRLASAWQQADARMAASAEKRAQQQAAADQRLAAAQARAQVQGMAQMSRMLDAHHKADADVALSAAKAEAIQTKANAQAALAAAKVQAIQSKTAATAKEAGAAQGQLGEALGGAAQSATSCGGAVGMLQNVLSKLGPQGQAAAIAIGAWTIAITAFVGTMVTAMGAAIEVTEKLSRLRTVLTALAGSTAGGAAALKTVQDLAKSLPFTTDQVGAWAKSLMAAGFAGDGLKSAIQAVAAATALMGEEGGAAAEKMLKTLQEGGQAADQLIKTVQAGGRKAATALAEMGLQTKDLASVLGVSEAKFKTMHLSAEQLQKAIEAALAKKGKGPLEEMAMTFPVMIAKVKEGIMSLFDKLGPAIKPFMAAVKSLFGEFSKGGGVINALKPVVTSVLTTAFQWATKAVTAIHEFVTAILNGGKAGGFLGTAFNAVKTVWSALVTIFGMVKTVLTPIIGLLKAIFSNATVMRGLLFLFKAIAVVIGVVVVAIGAVIAVFVTLAGLVAGAVGAIVGAVVWLGQSIQDVVVGAISWLSNLASGASAAAGSIVDGLLGFDPGAFVAKMAAMATAGLDAFKSVLGIKSPSRVMMQMGGHIATGAAEGVDDGAPKAQASMAKMVDPKALKVGAAGGKGGMYVDLRGSTFNGGAEESQVRALFYKVMDEEGLAGPEVSPA